MPSTNGLLIATFWFQSNGTLLLKLPKEISDKDAKLPIKLERKMALVLKDDCIEIRNLIPKEDGKLQY